MRRNRVHFTAIPPANRAQCRIGRQALPANMHSARLAKRRHSRFKAAPARWRGRVAEWFKAAVLKFAQIRIRQYHPVPHGR